MNKQLEKYVENLSKDDKKSLVLKTLKTSEECGELADRVLAYSSAPQSMHKVVTKQEILEESVDLTLTALSIPLSMGFSFDDIYGMMSKKCNKWAELQRNEKAKSHMFEIHIYLKVKDEAMTWFKTGCMEANVKPIIVENEGVAKLDVMTSSKFYGNFQTSLKEAERIKRVFQKRGFDVYRTKIETIPTHPAAIKTEEDNNFYMEAHLQIYIPSKVVKGKLVKLLKSYHYSHLSKNPFKKLAKGYIQMVSLREKVKPAVFEGAVMELQESLLMGGFQVIEKPEIEFCIYDDNKDKSKF